MDEALDLWPSLDHRICDRLRAEDIGLEKSRLSKMDRVTCVSAARWMTTSASSTSVSIKAALQTFPYQKRRRGCSPCNISFGRFSMQPA
jgi:hypothetical protein